MSDLLSSSPSPGAARIWSVSALVQAIADHLAARFARCQVRGEISGFTQAASGHCYFTLKDEDGSASLRCAMFRRSATALSLRPENGWRVEVVGELSVYGPRGELQLVVDTLRRAGAGSLYEEFLRLKAKLQAQGLFDAGRKRPIASHPQVVGIATSLQAAALHDVLTVFARRAPHVRLVVYPCAVQGAQAIEQICRAIETASERREVDTLIVCRGGGSMEDLWAYNAEAVAHAIARCAVPVISGVGHETDVTLADFVADLRAPTPSAAAELAAQPQAAGLQDLQRLAQRLQRWTRHRLDTCAQRLDSTALRLGRPQSVVEQHQERLTQLARRLTQALPRALHADTVDLTHLGRRFVWAAGQLHEARRHRLESLAVRLHAMDPRGVLRRGYAWLSTEAGQPLLSAAQARPGQVVMAHLTDGRLRTEVRDVLADADDPAGGEG